MEYIVYTEWKNIFTVYYLLQNVWIMGLHGKYGFLDIFCRSVSLTGRSISPWSCTPYYMNKQQSVNSSSSKLYEFVAYATYCNILQKYNTYIMLAWIEPFLKAQKFYVSHIWFCHPEHWQDSQQETRIKHNMVVFIGFTFTQEMWDVMIGGV